MLQNKIIINRRRRRTKLVGVWQEIMSKLSRQTTPPEFKISTRTGILMNKSLTKTRGQLCLEDVRVALHLEALGQIRWDHQDFRVEALSNKRNKTTKTTVLQMSHIRLNSGVSQQEFVPLNRSAKHLVKLGTCHPVLRVYLHETI